MYPIQINGNSLEAEAPHSGAHQPAALHFAAIDSAADELPQTNYFLIQTKEPVHAAEKAQLASKNIKIHEVVSRNTYLCGYKDKESATKPTVDEIRADLAGFVVFSDIYRPEFVVEPKLKNPDANPETVSVDVLVHDDVAIDSVVERIAAEAGIPAAAVEVVGGKLRIAVSQDRLANLATIDEVKTINAIPVFKGFNNVAKGILNVHKPVGVNDTVYKGKDQIVCVADTGFDTGNPALCHNAFKGRVVKVIPRGRPAARNGDDPDGHGTHVCGSVLGIADHKTQKTIEAPASQAKLVMQSLFDKWRKRDPRDPRTWQAGFGGIGPVISALFKEAVANGASIHTNSWGSFPDESGGTEEEINGYRASVTGDIDGYLWQNKDLVVLFAAGNSGADVDDKPGHVDPHSMGAEATSKNVITVGASESVRPDVKYDSPPRVWSQFGYDFEPIASDDVANNHEGLAAFSSRGPTKPDGRIKPDVVAPGTTILSARSSKIVAGHFRDDWGKSDDDKWCYNGGTSMACPLVAGCCAVIRGAMIDSAADKKPTAAIIKAVLVNGAVPLKGQYAQPASDPEFPPAPNFDYGFGRVDLHASLLHVVPEGPGLAGFGKGPALADNGVDDHEWTREIVVPEDVEGGDGKPRALKVTIVWNDRPAPFLSNDLDLTVSHGSRTLFGNGVQGGDRLNNVEQVTWDDVKPGEKYVVKVKAFSIPNDDFPQDFAYAWRIF